MFSNLSFKFVKRATLSVALFFISGPIVAAEKAETYKDLIEKAYNLSLQQDRAQALSILVGAAKRETHKGSAPKELLSAIEEVSTVFYSDKAQQLYELALSLKQTDLALCLAKLSEASRLEPENLSIQLEIMRAMIGSGDCSGAQKMSEKILETNPYSDQVRLHNAQSVLCLGKLEPTPFAPSDLTKNSLSLFWQQISVERMFKKAEFSEALDLLDKMEKQSSFYPEASYWRWKMETELKIKNEKSAQKYLASCRKITPRQFREFGSDPNLCRRVAEVENSLKKSHNP